MHVWINGKHEMAQEICTDAVVDSCNVLDKVYDSPQKDIRNPWKFSADYGGHEKEQDFYAAHRMELHPTLKGIYCAWHIGPSGAKTP